MVHRCNSGVVDENIESAVGPSHFRKHGLDGTFAADIKLEVAIVAVSEVARRPAATDDLKILIAIILRQISANSLAGSGDQD